MGHWPVGIDKQWKWAQRNDILFAYVCGNKRPYSINIMQIRAKLFILPFPSSLLIFLNLERWSFSFSFHRQLKRSPSLGWTFFCCCADSRQLPCAPVNAHWCCLLFAPINPPSDRTGKKEWRTKKEGNDEKKPGMKIKKNQQRTPSNVYRRILID